MLMSSGTVFSSECEHDLQLSRCSLRRAGRRGRLRLCGVGVRSVSPPALTEYGGGGKLVARALSSDSESWV